MIGVGPVIGGDAVITYPDPGGGEETPEETPWTFDSTEITFDQTDRTFDETT